MSISAIILSSAVKTAIDMIVKRVTSGSAGLRAIEVPDLSENLRAHLIEVANWSSQIQFFGMSAGKPTDDTTIGLAFHIEPRRFRKLSEAADGTKSEADLLLGPSHIMLFGDPGSGKTTTLKRIARSLLFEEAQSESETAQVRYPCVVKLRELSDELNIFEAIASQLGLSVSTKIVERPDARGNTIRAPERWIGDQEISLAVPSFLNKTGALLLIDGLDELPTDIREFTEKQLSKLVLRLTHSRLILTCRSGTTVLGLENVDSVEVCPLDQTQIQAIARKWLSEADSVSFWQQLQVLPYADLADRPLLLTQLLVLFERQRYFPEQPSEVAMQMVNLLLADWDNQRHLSRSSRYSGFTPDRKREFLSALAYHITYRTRIKRFNRTDLIDAYASMHESFGLPVGEAVEVAEEIETHTGVIVASGFQYFEFSHLSLQEYLCGDYLVREPFPDKLVEYLFHYPDPIAVAIARSSNPSNWLAGLVLKAVGFSSVTPESIYRLLSRLDTERPYFSRGVALGLAYLRLFDQFIVERIVTDHLIKNSMVPVVRYSIGDALQHYQAIGLTDKKVTFRLRFNYSDRFDLPAPYRGTLPLRVVEAVMADRVAILCQTSSTSLQLAGQIDDVLEIYDGSRPGKGANEAAS